MTADRQSLNYRAEEHGTMSRIAAVLSLIGGGIGWGLHLLLAWVISEFGCIAGWGDRSVGPITMVSLSILIATVISAGIAAAAVMVAMKASRGSGVTSGDHAVVAAENKGFISRFSFIMNMIFLFIILVQSIPVFFYLKEC